MKENSVAMISKEEAQAFYEELDGFVPVALGF